MEKITLSPGEWKRLDARCFQVIGQNAIRMALGTGNNATDATAPDLAAPYFVSQSYDPKIVNVANLLGFDFAPNFYVMPDGSKPVDIVVM